METIYQRQTGGGTNVVGNGDIIKEVVDTLNPGYGSERTNAIQKRVTAYITCILQEIEQSHPEFKVSELLKVGSYNEGTKIIEPNEFDFLAVVEELSREGAVDVEPVTSSTYTSGPEGLVHVNVAPELEHKWQRYMSNGHLRCFQLPRGYYYGNNPSFATAVFDAIMKFAKRDKCAYIRNRNSDMEIYSNAKQFDGNVMGTGEIRLKAAEAIYPNILLKFMTENMEVTADLCPAIRFSNIKKCFQPCNTASGKIAELVVNRGSILLVGRCELDFRVTFTETEVHYMRNEMQPQHRCLYMYFKHINDMFNEAATCCTKGFTSYMFKTLCVHHDLTCKAEEKTLYECFTCVTSLLNTAYKEGHLPSVFNTKLNLLRASSFYACITMKHCMHAFSIIQRSLFVNSVAEHKREVSAIVESVVKQCQREYYPSGMYMVPAASGEQDCFEPSHTPY